jgi:3-isopropylmalate/(R)-2-methylmalate dehydratase large subunit
MGMTIAEKILASHSGKAIVRPGEYVWATIDETNAEPETFESLEKLGIQKVFDPDRIFVVSDHLAPPANIPSAEAVATLRRGVQKYGIKHWFEYGRHGILHQLFPEQGFVQPGDLIAMVDSHSTTYGAFNAASCAIYVEAIHILITGRLWFRVPETIKFEIQGKMPPLCVGKDVILKIAAEYGTDVAIYKSIEFQGPAVRTMSLASRITMCNMGSELGAKFAIVEADEKTFDFLRGRTSKPYTPVFADPDACYESIYTVDITKLTPMVALPHDPSNSKPVTEAKGIKIHQAFIGACTNGRQEDLEMAAKILKGRKVHPSVRLIVSPASMEVWKDALEAGWLKTFIDAEALVCHPTCGPCAGQHLGILAAGERCLSTTNRNFQGRMGSPDSEVFLANAATVAASAIAGEIADPREF